MGTADFLSQVSEISLFYISCPVAKFETIYEDVGIRLAQLPNSFTGDVSIEEDKEDLTLTPPGTPAVNGKRKLFETSTKVTKKKAETEELSRLIYRSSILARAQENKLVRFQTTMEKYGPQLDSLMEKLDKCRSLLNTDLQKACSTLKDFIQDLKVLK